MADEPLPARFSLRSQHWFRWTVKCLETATSHIRTVTCNMKLIQLLFFLLIPISGFCCDCPKGTTEKNYETNQVVVTVEVIKQRKIRRSRDGNYKMKFKLKVLKKYKGNVSHNFTIVTGNGFGDCGFRFELGKKYLLFAQKSDFYNDGRKMEYITSICSKTGLVDERKDELKIIENIN